MGSEFPSELIQSIQIRLRQAAGLDSYDPANPELAALPSIEETVAALDPSLPHYLRCKRCHGGLPRGISSTLCIFCGAEQRREGITKTVSFTSTAGYLKLLQSLDLDGSETVIFETEKKDSSKSQGSPESGLLLSNLLDLELKWPREVPEKDVDSNSISKSPYQVDPVSLSGINLDNFFSDQKNEFSSKPSASSSAENAQPTGLSGANISSVDLDSFFSGTRTEINSSSQNTGFQSVGLFESHDSVDMINISSDSKVADVDDTDWGSDFQSASSATVLVEPKQVDLFQNAMDNKPGKTTDLFHNSAEFVLFNSVADAAESCQTNLFQNSASDFLIDSVNRSDQTAEFCQVNTDLLIADNQFINSSKTVSEDFKSEVQQDGTSVAINWVKDDQWPISTANEISGKTGNDNEEDDLYDDWQDFTTSAIELGSSSRLEEETSKLFTSSGSHSSEGKFGDLDDMEFGSFKQSEFFSRPIDDQETSVDPNKIHEDASFADETIQFSKDSGDDLPDASDPSSSKSKVDMLLAKMPDLSFMLEDTLCVPKKPSASNLQS
ncbi:hypothetical protein AXF42_Ash005771 [Apostasia shenzhenica]|uniref:DUF7815 domain-containing protein n=1 Tax=Apostasia shenzhenica TaxID=1088818 RepID=A0A2I0BCB6_9ASPA|nr:hypothetical protein AXF42_Ash005771 [Apostasia shenzhenica]